MPSSRIKMQYAIVARIRLTAIQGLETRTPMAGNQSCDLAMKIIVAAKAMALAAVRTMNRPDIIEEAKKIVLLQNGGSYECPLPDYVKPPVGRY
jgi:ketopantoate reductase